MVNKQSYSINNSAGEPVEIDLFQLDTSDIKPTVIFSHGFKGFKDWGGFPYLMIRLAEAGYAAVSFNFSHNGVTRETPMDFTRLDLFAENTHSKELDDIESVINYVFQNAAPMNINPDKVSLMGHSRGGGITIIKASEDSRIKCFVTLASVSTFDRYTDEQKKKWRETGYIEIPNVRTNQMMKLNISLLDDIEQNHEQLNIKNAMNSVKIPALIIHGQEDLAVRVGEAQQLYESSDKNKTTLILLPSTGHTFGIEHPFTQTTKAFEEVINSSITFLGKNL